MLMEIYLIYPGNNRKEKKNYTTQNLNGLRKRPILFKTKTWNFHWCYENKSQKLPERINILHKEMKNQIKLMSPQDIFSQWKNFLNLKYKKYQI